MSLSHTLDGGDISLEIDIDRGARISSLNFRGIECVLPFRGQTLTWGWYAMAPWAGRIRDGLIEDKAGKVFQLPTNFAPPHAIHGFTLTHPWEGRRMQSCRPPLPPVGSQRSNPKRLSTTPQLVHPVSPQLLQCPGASSS